MNNTVTSINNSVTVVLNEKITQSELQKKLVHIELAIENIDSGDRRNYLRQLLIDIAEKL